MRVIDLDNINLAMRNEEQFVLRCEEVFHDKISSAAATILAGKDKSPSWLSPVPPAPARPPQPCACSSIWRTWA